MQSELFPTPELARARRSDPDTSKSAAHSVPVAELEAKVLRALRDHPRGLTSHEVAELLDMPLVSVSPRFKPLTVKNLVRAHPAMP
jgi:hypothetical protein